MAIEWTRESPIRIAAFTLEPVPGSSAPTLIVRTTSPDEVRCVAFGDGLRYEVRLQNDGSSPIEAVVLHDTLTGEFAGGPEAGDIQLNEAAFPAANVVFSADGRSFEVVLGSVEPTEGDGILVHGDVARGRERGLLVPCSHRS